MTNDSKYLIYSTFHPTGHLSRHVVDQLNAYKQLGFEIIVVDTSPEYTPERQAYYAKIGTTAIHRENTGYDFTSYKVGFQKLQTMHQGATAPWILIANDSCFGPLFPLEELFAKVPTTDEKPTCYGLTESWDRDTFHLQSYWLYFNPNSFEALKKYFELLPEIKDREDAIQFGELGLGHFLGFQKVALLPLFSQDDCYKALTQNLRFPLMAKYKLWFLERRKHQVNRVIAKGVSKYLKQKARFRQLNPSIYLIPTLVDELHSPFAKIQRFRDTIFKSNPYWTQWAKDALERYPILAEQCADYAATYKPLLNLPLKTLSKR